MLKLDWTALKGTTYAWKVMVASQAFKIWGLLAVVKYLKQLFTNCIYYLKKQLIFNTWAILVSSIYLVTNKMNQSMYDLITELCEKHINKSKFIEQGIEIKPKLRKYRSKSFEIILKKRYMPGTNYLIHNINTVYHSTFYA